ncbi:unnamed protein product [Choristocarpus tenellus]
MGPEHELGRKGHTPLEERKRGKSYSEMALNLSGKRRDRLDRHLAMKVAGGESGKSHAFFSEMLMQGGLEGAQQEKEEEGDHVLSDGVEKMCGGSPSAGEDPA